MPIINAYAPAECATTVLGSVEIQVNPLFPAHADTLQNGQVLPYSGVLRVDTGSTEAYTQWRERLAEMMGLPETDISAYGVAAKSRAVTAMDAPAQAFQDLFAFSNTDGVIGAQACIRLLDDFVACTDKAAVFFQDDEDGMNFYIRMGELFEFATENNGFVQLSHPSKRTGQRRMAFSPDEVPATM